jgi:hypothetical protein
MDDRLAPFIGEWAVASSLSDDLGTATFEWILGGRFMVQRVEIAHPDAPDSFAILGYEDDGYVQHYFDSRGVVRRYEMSLEGGVWTLWRDEPGFAQRWTGTFSDDGNTIAGAWELNGEKDFEMTYTRSASEGAPPGHARS